MSSRKKSDWLVNCFFIEKKIVRDLVIMDGSAVPYADIDNFNYEIFRDNFLGNVIFLGHRDIQNRFIAYIIDIVEKNFKMMPEKHIPLAIKEIIEIYKDPTGEVLLDYIKKSMGVKSTVDEASINVAEENKRKTQTSDFIKKINTIGDNLRKMDKSIESIKDSEIPFKSKKRSLSESSGSADQSNQPSLMSEYEKIKIQRNWHYFLIKEEKHFMQLLTYKRLILLIQINVYARSKGLYMKEQGYNIDHMMILKDIRDILIFSAPILWPEILEALKNTDSENGKVFPFPTDYVRSIIARSFFKEKVSIYLDSILNIQEFDDDIVTKIPLDKFVNVCRVWLMAIINKTDPRIKYL